VAVTTTSLLIRPGAGLDSLTDGPENAANGDAVRLQRWRALGFDGEPDPYPDTSSSEAAKLRRANDRIPSAVEVAAEGVGQAAHAGMQLYVSQHGTPEAEAAVGWATGNAVLTTRTLLPLFCGIKPLFVLGFGLLWEAGELDLWQPVRDVVPEFKGGGKERLTFWHLLTHTSGISPDPFHHALWGTRDERLQAVWDAELAPGAAPGAQANYAEFWAWAVLSEAIERRSGTSYTEFLQREVLEPLGIEDCILEVTEQTWEQHGDRIGPVLDVGAADLAPQLFMSSEHSWQLGDYAPGSIGFGSAGALGRLAEAFLPHPPRPLLRPQTVAAICSKHRVGMWDEHWGCFLSWGLGLIADGWPFGSHCSPSTVGIVGHTTSFFAVDPAHEIVVSGIGNGLCGCHTAADRDHRIIDGVYRDLSLPAALRPAPQIVAVEPSGPPDVVPTH
jgi:CubicO group peptidase (beta-lactamase class C family)